MNKLLRNEIRTVLAMGLVSVAFNPTAYAQQAEGQQPTASETQEAKPRAVLQEIVITGTRIRHIEGQAATVSITSVVADELVKQGDVNVGDALNDLPALRSTFTQGNSTRFIGTAGLNWLDLRGLGTARTLVLVNNRRHVTSSPGDYLVDVNTIPSDLIERVDLVTGGNSAVYGSDAVAGVVNFVTRRDFDGVRVRAQAGASSRSDRDTDFVSLIAGHNFAEDRGNVAVALEWGKTDALYFNERDSLTGAFSGRHQFNLAEDTAGEPGGSDGISDRQFFDGGIFNAGIADGGVVSVNASGNPASAVFCGNLPEPTRSQRCLPNNQPRIFSFDRSGNLVETIPGTDFRPFGSGNVQISGNPGDLSSLRNTGQLAAGLERYSANLLAHYDVTDTFRPFLEAKFVHIDATQEGQPSFWQGSIPGFFGGGTNLSCSNPYLTAQSLATLQTLGRCATPASTFNMGRFNVDFGGRGELHDRDTYRVVAGFEGDFNDDWNYEVSVNYGHLDTKLRSLNNLLLFTNPDFNDDGFLLAVNAVRNGAGEIVCGVNADADPTNDRPDCVPINVFGFGAPSQEALDFVNTTSLRNEKAEQFVVSAFVSGDLSQLFELPGGPIGFALGAEYRTEKAESVFDELTASGATFLNAIQPFNPPDLKVKEIFGELRVPILGDLPMVHELTLEGAGRISDYNTATGDVSAYNAGLIYAPIADLRFRGNVSTSVRAPTQTDLYSPQSQNFEFVSDPCDVLFINDNPNRAANCAAAGVPVGFVNTVARSQTIGFLQGGNPTLVEEEGDSYTIGAMFTPSSLPGFAIAIDYWNIEVKALISALGAQDILDQCYNSPSGINNPFCATVSREPNSEFSPVAVIAGGVNFAKQETDGVDVDASYSTTMSNGHRLNTRLIYTQVLTLNNYVNPSDPSEPNRQLSELGDPKEAWNLNLGYGIGNLDLSYNLRYLGKQTTAVEYEDQHSFNGNPPFNADAFPRDYFSSQMYHSIRGEYAVSDNLRVFGGVDNLTDNLPPLGQLGVSGGDPYDSIGRYIYFGMTVDL